MVENYEVQKRLLELDASDIRLIAAYPEVGDRWVGILNQYGDFIPLEVVGTSR